MANTANADKCEIVCTPIEVTNKNKLIAEKNNGRFIIQEGENQQEIKLNPGKLTDKFINGASYAKTLEKQKSYKAKLNAKEKNNSEEER